MWFVLKDEEVSELNKSEASSFPASSEASSTAPQS